MATVNWHLLSEAVTFYAREGQFSLIDVPWAVPKEDVMITCPSEDAALTVPELGSLVGSAEQSFVSLSRRGQLKPGRWMAITPCFRKEPVLDDLHLPYFMKLELFDSSLSDRMPFLEMTYLAQRFFLEVGEAPEELLKIGKTEEGTDLVLNDIEIGSYGSREYENVSWNYGTGLAEPRFSTALERIHP